MARISLVEQYDNKDVIQQIYVLKDGLETTQEQAEQANATATQALNSAGSAASTANEAIQTANTANTNASDALTQVAQAQADVTQALADAEQAQTDADNAIVSGSITTDTTSGNLVLTRGTGSAVTTPIPIASASQTGLMNAQTYAGLTNLNARVSALEGKNTTVYVTFPNNDPDQATITSVFTTKAGRAPVAGDYAVDLAKNLTYGYDGTTWTKVGTDVSVPQFSLGSPGLIVGSDEDGTVFAETDGTGSVKGWDVLTGKVSTNETDIDALQTSMTQVEGDISEIQTSLGGKQGTLTSVTVTLTVAGWANNQQTITASNVTADNIVWVSPAPASFDAYGEAGIRAIAQGAGTITFQCTTVPTAEITVEVVA